jgi:hypothetical protein
MNSRFTVISTILAIFVTASQALAIQPAAAANRGEASPAPAGGIESKLSGDFSAGAFVNVKRLFALYGDLIQKQASYKEFVAKHVALGCPDPAKDVGEVGVVANIDKLEKSDFAVVGTGAFNIEKVWAYVQSQQKPGDAPLVPSMIRGVTLMTDKAKDGTLVQMGFYDEKTALVSVSRTDAAARTRDTIATLKGESPSFGTATRLQLPANYIANLSVKVPAEFYNAVGKYLPEEFAAVKKVESVSAYITAEDASKDATAVVRLACGEEPNAAALEQIVKGLKEMAGGMTNGHGAQTEVLESIKISHSGAIVELSVTVPRAEMEKLVTEK